MQCAIGYYKILEKTIISVDFNSFTGVGNRQGPPFAGDADGEIGGEGRPESKNRPQLDVLKWLRA